MQNYSVGWNRRKSFFSAAISSTRFSIRPGQFLRVVKWTQFNSQFSSDMFLYRTALVNVNTNVIGVIREPKYWWYLPDSINQGGSASDTILCASREIIGVFFRRSVGCLKPIHRCVMFELPVSLQGVKSPLFLLLGDRSLIRIWCLISRSLGLFLQFYLCV